MSVIFEPEELTASVKNLLLHAPPILERSRLTASFASQLVQLRSVIDAPFAVAVVGQMRVGKSSVINALVGRDVAVTGVTETTATINWIKYGSGDRVGQFRVQWRGRPAEDFDRSELDHWVGDTERAGETAWLELFAEADFLKVANIVDTPGTRSVIDSHTEATDAFLSSAVQREAETRELGGQADAIIYVMMPVARESDDELLNSFADQTQLPGSGPFNSVGVVHKWEALDAEDPHHEAIRKAVRIRNALEDQLSGVIPVSAPLALAALDLDEEVWQELADFSMDASDEPMRKALRSERHFRERMISGLPAPQRRQDIRDRSNLPWSCFRYVLQMARREGLRSAEDLRSVVRTDSGIDELRSVLEERFFSRARTVKTKSVLAKSLMPCRQAERLIRQRKIELAVSLAEMPNMKQLLESRLNRGDKALAPVLQYLQQTEELSTEKMDRLSSALVEMSRIMSPVILAHEDLEQDQRAIGLIDRASAEIPVQERKQLLAALGAFGTGINHRLACLENASESVESELEALIDKWRNKYRHAERGLRNATEQASNRLGQLIDALEERSEASSGNERR
jgi:hypothetical protein